MSGWEIGDLAVCVDDSPCTRPAIRGLPFGFRKGESAVVAEIHIDATGDLGLSFAGKQTHNPYALGFSATRFRKVKPDAHEGGMEDWQLLIDAMRVPATLSGERV